MTRLILSLYAHYPTLQLVGCKFVPDLNSNFSLQPARWHFLGGLCHSVRDGWIIWNPAIIVSWCFLYYSHSYSHSYSCLPSRSWSTQALKWVYATAVEFCIVIDVRERASYQRYQLPRHLYLYLNPVYVYVCFANVSVSAFESVQKGVYIHEYTYICSGAQLVHWEPVI